MGITPFNLSIMFPQSCCYSVTDQLLVPFSQVYLPFYLEVSKSIITGVQWRALSHIKNGLTNFLNKTAVLNHLGLSAVLFRS